MGRLTNGRLAVILDEPYDARGCHPERLSWNHFVLGSRVKGLAVEVGRSVPQVDPSLQGLTLSETVEVAQDDRVALDAEDDTI